MENENLATHKQPITGALYRRIDDIWYVFSRIENEPRRWIKSPGTHESALAPIKGAKQ